MTHVIRKLRVLYDGGPGHAFVTLDEVAGAAREVQRRGIVFDSQDDFILARLARNGVIHPTKWVVETDLGAIDWHWDYTARHGLRELIVALDAA